MYLRVLRILLYTVVAIASFLSLERLCHLATDGFSVLKITHKLPQSPRAEEPTPPIHTILSQSFRYLDSGAQSYVFLSEDEQYVIKFFKFQHMRIPQWINYVPLPKNLEEYRHHKIAKKNKVIEKLFLSYQIGYNLLQEETGLVYLHLNKTKEHCPLHLIDKIGVHYLIEGSDIAFVIQRKGTLFYEALKQDMQKGDITHAKEVISSLLKLTILRCKKGVGDEDPDFRTNFGIISGNVAQLDVGRFYLEEHERDPEVYKRELYRITRNFRKWLEETYPPLLSYFDENIDLIKGETSFE